MNSNMTYDIRAYADLHLDETVEGTHGNSIRDFFTDTTCLQQMLATDVRYGSYVNPWLERVLSLGASSVLEINTLDIPDAIAKIRDSFGFNTTEVTKIFLVSRPTVYSWSDGGNIKKKHRQRVSVIYDIAEAWSSISEEPMGELCRESIGGDASLFQLLSQEIIDQDLVLRQLKLIHEKLASSRLSKLPSATELRESYGLEKLSDDDFRRSIKLRPRRT